MKNINLAVIAFSLLMGCGPKGPEHSRDDGHDHAVENEHAHGGHDDHREEVEGARFAEGKGIALMDETKRAIGLELAKVEERRLTPIVPIEARIYRSAGEPSRPGAEQMGSAYAAALVSPTLASRLKPGDAASLQTHDAEYSASVWKIDPASREAVNNEEVILQIADAANALRVGTFVSGHVIQSRGEEAVVSIPRSAVLETATGKFVFVENGSHLLRTPVATGAESAEFVEITDGLYSGDVVVSKPVETLYLIELRATKGGGHSH